MMPEDTLLGIIENFRRRDAGTAFVCRRQYRRARWSYGQVADLSGRLAAVLRRRGVGRGDRIVLWGYDGPEWVATFFACVLRGAVTVPMDRDAALDFVRRVCRQVGAKLCIGARGNPQIDPLLPTIAFEDFPELAARHDAGATREEEPGSDDPVEIVFTSGTTAEPKGVVLTHGNILANLVPLEREISRYLKYERFVHPLRFLNLLPLSHVCGQFLGIFIPQILGGTVVFQDTLNPSGILRTIRKERVSVLVAVPRVLETLQAKVERDLEIAGGLEAFRREFRAAEGERLVRRWWRFRSVHRKFGWKFWAFISGGASLHEKNEEFWSRLGFAVIQGYGLTETASLISLNHPFRLGKGSVGRVLPGREVRLSEDGEILVRGESIAKSYFQGRALVPVSGSEGWFHTGDLGALDAQGNLHFRGRRKNVIVSPEGFNIHPEDLETALRRQPGVRDCAVVALDRGGNSEACAVLLLEAGADRPERVVERANETLAGFQRIRHFHVWPDEDFPRTPTQKAHIGRIREAVAKRFDLQPGTEPGGRMLADLVRQVTRRHIDGISANSRLAQDLNLSSIERVELLGALEDRFQVDLNESRFTAASTIGDLERMLAGPADQRTNVHYPRWTQSAFWETVRVLAYYLLSWPATMLLACPRIRGRENLRPLRGPVLFIANHVTRVDAGFVLAALPPRYRHRLAVAMLGEMLEEMRCPPATLPWPRRLAARVSYGLVVALFNVFPLPQQTGFRESFAYAGESVDRGFSVLVFPEGKRTRDGTLSPFRAGIGLLASNLGLPVVPIRIDGLFEAKRAGRIFVRPGAVRVSIGEPARFSGCPDAERVARDLERLLASV